MAVWIVGTFVALYTIHISARQTTADEDGSYQQPNFLFLMVDSMDGRNMDPTSSIYNTMQMPNLRAIADEGTQFIKHYTNSPQCVPGRSCLITGRRIDQIRTWSNEMGIALFVNQSKADPICVKSYGNSTCFALGAVQNVNYTLLSGLEDVGYTVYLNGRMDVGAGITSLPSQPDSDSDGWHKGPKLGIVTSSANIQRPTKKNPMTMVGDEKDDHFATDKRRVEHCIKRIDTLKHLKSPWFMQCSLMLPHPPFYANEKWLTDINVSDISTPIWINESSFHPYDQFMTISKDGWGEFAESDIQRLRKTYYGMNVEADNLLGKVIDAMNRNGFNLSNTIMYFTSDHGEMNMDHRQIWKNSMYEGSSRIPLFFAGPGIERGIITKPTQSIGILPTIIELATGDKQHIPSWLSGNSLVPFLRGEGADYTEYPPFITSQYHSNMGNTGSFMVRWDRYKYIQFGHYLKAYKDYEPQLFDLEADPLELHDISKEHPVICEQMEEMLLSKYHYEEVDCHAKQLQYDLFEEYFWEKFSEKELREQCEKRYFGFDDSDWNTLMEWRKEMEEAPSCDEVANMSAPLKYHDDHHRVNSTNSSTTSEYTNSSIISEYTNMNSTYTQAPYNTVDDEYANLDNTEDDNFSIESTVSNMFALIVTGSYAVYPTEEEENQEASWRKQSSGTLDVNHVIILCIFLMAGSASALYFMLYRRRPKLYLEVEEDDECPNLGRE